MVDSRHEDEASQRIFEHLHLAPLPPVHGWSDPGQLHLDDAPACPLTPEQELAIDMA